MIIFTFRLIGRLDPPLVPQTGHPSVPFLSSPSASSVYCVPPIPSFAWPFIPVALKLSLNAAAQPAPVTALGILGMDEAEELPRVASPPRRCSRMSACLHAGGGPVGGAGVAGARSQGKRLLSRIQVWIGTVR